MNPLNFIIDDSALKHQRIETTTIYPRTINDNVNGGICRFVLPNKGFLSANTCIVLPATCVDECFQYAPNAGVYSLLKVARFSCGDQVISEIQNVGQLLAQKKLLEQQEVRERMSQVKEGINFSFECGSGSKRDGNRGGMEVLQGQQRLVCNKYENEYGAQFIPGRKASFPNILNGKIHSGYKLKTFSNDTTDEAGTPEFFIYLKDLFSNYFGAGLELPLQLINRDDEISIELQFSNDGDLGNNERAIFCPALESKPSDGYKGNTALAHIERVGDVNAESQDLKGNIIKVDANDGTGLIIKFDLTGEDITEYSVLSPGYGYNGNSIQFNFGGATFSFIPAFRHWTMKSDLNYFQVSDVGAGYGNNETNADATLTAKGSVDASCKVKISTNGNGEVTSVKYASEEDRARFLFNPTQRYDLVKEGSTTTAKVRPAVALFTLTNPGALTGVFAVGDAVRSSVDANSVAYVKTVVANAPTELWYAKGSFNDGEGLQKISDAGVNLASVDFLTDGAPDKTFAYQDGLGSSGLAGFNGRGDDGHIKVVTDKVVMLADIVYYEDDTVANMMKQMAQGGKVQNYTEYRNVVTTLSQESATGYNDKVRGEHIRLIGFSNEILRNLMIQAIPTIDTQNNDEFPNYGLPRVNPLLGQYCSRDSLAENGVELNVVINSVPFYAQAVNFNPQLFEELSYVNNKPLYVPHSAYCGWTSAKQLDNNGDAENSYQPAFSTLDSISLGTSRYELNERCAGMCNQLYEGVGQENLIGNLSYLGVSFKTSPFNVPGNGVAVGAQAVEIQYTYNATYNPLYNGNCMLNIYGEVERRLMLDQNGRITVSNAGAM